MKNIKLMADYGCWPLWYNDPKDVYNVGPFDPNTWPLSESLIVDLADWQKTFDSTIDMNDPADAGFYSQEDLEQFTLTGRVLKTRIEQELPNIEVDYFEECYGVKDKLR
jgi:hypothetical protein